MGRPKSMEVKFGSNFCRLILFLFDQKILFFRKENLESKTVDFARKNNAEINENAFGTLLNNSQTPSSNFSITFNQL